MRPRRDRRRCRPAAERLEARDLPAITIDLIVEYPLPTAGSGPVGVAPGPDGGIWITESAANQIARYDPQTGAFAEYAVPTAKSTPYRIVPGGAGDPSLYFTENTGGKLGRITTSGTISEAPVTDGGGNPIPNSPLVGLAYDPLGSAIYASQSNARQVGLFEVGDFFEYIPYQPGQSRPTASAPGSTNWGVAFDSGLQSTAVYFTERDGDKIGVFQADASNSYVTREVALAAGSEPLDIVKGPDGAFWFTQYGTSKIGRIDPKTLAVTEYATPTADSGPWGITSSDKHLYFTESTAGKIGRISLDSGGNPTILEYALPSGGTPRGITVGQDGQVWFADESGNELGLFFGDATNVSYAFTAAVPFPSTAYLPYGLAAAPDGNVYAYIYEISAQTRLVDGVARINPTALTATVNPFGESNVGAGPIGGGWMTVGYDGNLWTGGPTFGTLVFTSADLPYLNPVRRFNSPFAMLARGPDGKSMYGPYLGAGGGESDAYIGFARFDDSGMTDIPLPLDAAWSTTFDAAGNLWTIGFDFGLGCSVIARTDTGGGGATKFPVTGSGGVDIDAIDYIAVAPDGNVWFTSNGTQEIGRLKPSTGKVTLYPAGGDNPDSTNGYVLSLIAAPDGNLYYLNALTGALVRVDPATGTRTSFPIPTRIGPTTFVYPINTLAVGPDGNLWISNADPSEPAVVRFSLPKAGEPAGPTIGSYLDDVFRRLTGAEPTAARRRALLAQALGPRHLAAVATPLDALDAGRRGHVTGRLAAAVLHAPEYRRARLERLSYAALRRPADPRLLRTPGPVEALRLGVLGSRAYLEARAAGGSRQAFVAALYRDVLRRAPTAAEARRWERALARGASRHAVAAALARSPEGLAAAVQGAYRRLLGHPAGPRELAAGVRLLRRAGSAALARALVTSDEFIAAT